MFKKFFLKIIFLLFLRFRYKFLKKPLGTENVAIAKKPLEKKQTLPEKHPIKEKPSFHMKLRSKVPKLFGLETNKTSTHHMKLRKQCNFFDRYLVIHSHRFNV